MKHAWMLPLGMVAFNLVYVILTFLSEYRIKPNALRFAAMYAATVMPAARGNMDPFFTVLTAPVI